MYAPLVAALAYASPFVESGAWTKNGSNIKEIAKRSFACIGCYERFSAPTALNRDIIFYNSMTFEVYPSEKKVSKFL